MKNLNAEKVGIENTEEEDAYEYIKLRKKIRFGITNASKEKI